MKSAPHKPLLHFSFFFWWHQMNESSSSLISPLSLIHSLSLTSRQAWRMLGVAARGKNVDVFGVFFCLFVFLEIRRLPARVMSDGIWSRVLVCVGSPQQHRPAACVMVD